MALGSLDQHQDSVGTAFGFGELAVIRYRGGLFVPAIAGNLATLGFDRVKGSQGVKVYIDTSSGGLAPDHAVGSELYSWEIPNASLVSGYGEYDLPVSLTLMTGTQYCFYLAPWNTTTHAYSDDYQDCNGINSGSKEITYNAGWFQENLTLHYSTYMQVNVGGGIHNYPRHMKIGNGISRGESAT